ncbi:MAG TPA: SDR family NAD(P)-dependent oxidoreductase [Opitutus sp.]|nr:SDR family NAD(P)-dependent oxidoreductase [Opitutus sp.]
MSPYTNTLAGKVALVTGVGSGIGKATAELLAQAGARVAGLSKEFDDAQATCAGILARGGEALPIGGDVSSSSDLRSAVGLIEETWRRLDIVVANAGINGLWAPLDEMSEQDWEQTLDVNLKGTFLTVKYALPLLKRGGGSIVVVSSVNGTRMFSNSGASAYSSSKAGQVAFARMTALELAKHKIRVNTVCPGAIDTNIDENTRRQHLDAAREPVEFPEGEIPLTDGQPGSSEQVARLIWFLVSDLADHITGSEVYIDGAQSLLQG